MMLHAKIKFFLIGITLFFLGLGVYRRILPVHPKTPATTALLISNVAINCGFVGNSTALDGRKWIGESALGMEFTSGESSSSVHVQTSFRGVTVDPVPYKTSRVSATEFRYTFPVIPGQKIVRLHFYPASYRGFEKWVDYFSVKAGPFTLLRNYSASLAAQASGLSYVIKEFCLSVEEGKRELMISFSPSLLDKSRKNKAYAFVNGIEIISMPSGLYYTAEEELGAHVVGLSSYIIGSNTALEVMHRLNVGGNSINSMEDFGLFRQWAEDSSYLVEPRGRRVSHSALNNKNIPASVAPVKLYLTSRKIETEFYNKFYHLTWKLPIDLGFVYLVRLHFCELDYWMTERTLGKFTVLIHNQITKTWTDVIRWSGDMGIPIYKDYVVVMEEGDEEVSKPHLMISLESADEFVFGLLKGMEVFKVSDLENNLAAPVLVLPKGPKNQKNENLYMASVFGTTMTIIIILLSIVAYSLRKCHEKKYCDGKSAESAYNELSCRCFSLAEIKLATKNFSDEFFIGKGGFGKVYRGVIRDVPGIVAIKRLHWFSTQGANEFRAEIETLSKLRHIHLVSLIGCCNESTEKILVYAYVPGGTLADNLYKFSRKRKDCVPLSWEQRLKICIGAARGLDYLHTSGEYGVIHRDIKDTNILLDKNFVAKISDFGLSKLEKVTPSKSYVSTKVKGTVGYLDPYYRSTYKLTRKSDVYSFGIVMLVVLSGKPAIEARNHGERVTLLSRFEECLVAGDVCGIVDSSLQGQISSKCLKKYVKTVENCSLLPPKKRPTMAQVVSSLERALELHQHFVSSGFGVESVKMDGSLRKKTVDRKVDPVEFQKKLEQETHEEVDQLSPLSEEDYESTDAKESSSSDGKEVKKDDQKDNNRLTNYQNQRQKMIPEEDKKVDDDGFKNKARNSNEAAKEQLKEKPHDNADQESKEGQKKENIENNNGGGSYAFILEKDLHCKDCAKTVDKFLRRFSGVETVKVEKMKIMVEGSFDPIELKDKLQQKSTNDIIVRQILPISRKDKENAKAKDIAGDAEGHKKTDSSIKGKYDNTTKMEKYTKSDDDDDFEKKKNIEVANEQQAEEMEIYFRNKENRSDSASVIGVAGGGENKGFILKLDFHCQGCVDRIKKFIRDFEGIEALKPNCITEEITIYGKFDPEEVRKKLEKKFKRRVELYECNI